MNTRGVSPSRKASEDELAKLILATARGDTQGFEVLVETIKQPLIPFIIGQYHLDETEAEAIFNVVITNVWNSAHTWKGLSAWGWIYQIARNTTVSHLRAEKRHIAKNETNLILERDGEELPSCLDTAVSEKVGPERTLISRENMTELYAMLKPEEKKILDYLAEGYKQKQIAEIFGLTPGRISQVVKVIKAQAELWSKDLE